MDQVLLIILGSALTLVGSIAVQILRSNSEQRQWERERNERRLMDAATDLARLRVFVEEYHPEAMVANFNPDDPYTEGNRKIEEWRPLRPPVTRIGLVHPVLSGEVDELIKQVLRMINITGWSIRAVVGGRTEDKIPKATEAKTKALDLIAGISEKITQSA